MPEQVQPILTARFQPAWAVCKGREGSLALRWSRNWFGYVHVSSIQGCKSLCHHSDPDCLFGILTRHSQSYCQCSDHSNQQECHIFLIKILGRILQCPLIFFPSGSFLRTRKDWKLLFARGWAEFGHSCCVPLAFLCPLNHISVFCALLQTHIWAWPCS